MIFQIKQFHKITHTAKGILNFTLLKYDYHKIGDYWLQVLNKKTLTTYYAFRGVYFKGKMIYHTIKDLIAIFQLKK